MAEAPVQTVALHRDTPAKPAPGQPCNGCGVCCAVETCPAGRLLFRRRHGPCPALHWAETESRYRCALAAHPERHLPLPAQLARTAAVLFRRWIAAGKGCDCDFQLED